MSLALAVPLLLLLASCLVVIGPDRTLHTRTKLAAYPVGAAFDPNQHDCISHQPSADVPEEKVMQVVRLGYALNGRLLRPASVVVSSGPAKSAEGVVI